MTYLGAFHSIPSPRKPNPNARLARDEVKSFSGSKCVIRYGNNRLFDNRNEKDISGSLFDKISDHVLNMEVLYKYTDSGILFIDLKL